MRSGKITQIEYYRATVSLLTFTNKIATQTE